ncbi:MAG: prephenate dehydrogenase/arogenate dehydrogenase family protein [Chloroflexi bacterium]|nr:MAG: prephenate dehydrogenase/arogenate dehydrogenase family protein [Chloroflexota bacterium]
MPRVAIIGTGLIGASIGLGLKANGAPGLEIVGSDRFRDNARGAEQVHAVDRVEVDPRKAVQGAGLVIIAVPILAIHEVMEEIAGSLEPGAVVTDTGSTKGDVLRWARELLPSNVAFVGGHPMAGKTESGPRAADAKLFEGARWVIAAPRHTPGDAVEVVNGLASGLGAVPQFMDAMEHDAYVAAISHLPMAAATALFRLARSSEAWPELSVLASTGFKDTTRLTATEPAMAHDILITNREQIVGWLRRYREELHKLEDEIANINDEAALFRSISETNLQYTGFREGVVGRQEVHDNMLDEIPEAGMMDLILGGALAERARELQKRSEERLAESEREMRSGGRGQ